MNGTGYVSGIGAANMDLHGVSADPLRLHDSNPGRFYYSPGGVTRNILENLARMGGGARLFSAVGDDANAREILVSARAAGIDVDHVLRCPGRASSGYLALIDPTGEMFVAMSDMRILDALTPALLEGKKDVLRASAAVVCDPCLPEETLEWIASGALDGTPLFADPVSTAYARRLRPFAGSFYCVKPNVMELGALTGREILTDGDMEAAADVLLDRGVHRVVVSMGRRGCFWADRDGNRFYRALRPVKRMTDATGAGDAFMGGLLYAHLHDMTPERSADWALAAGIIAVTSAGTVSPGMSAQLIEKILEENRK